MTNNKNDGKHQCSDVQNRFTAYLLLGVKRRKQEFIEDKVRKTRADNMIYRVFNPYDFDFDTHIISTIPLHLQIKNDRLFDPVFQLTEREKYIFLQHTLCQVSFEILAQELDSTYKSVSNIFYRALKKVRDNLGRSNNEL